MRTGRHHPFGLVRAFAAWLLALSSMAAAERVVAEQVPFETQGRIVLDGSTNDTVPRLVELVDFDVDGDLDIIVRQGSFTANGSSLFWLRNSGLVFSYQGIAGGDLAGPDLGDIEAHTIADFDGNGSPDVIVLRGGGLDLLTYDKGSVLDLVQDGVTSTALLPAIASGDVDGDGLPEVVGALDEGNVEWWAPASSTGWSGTTVSAVPGGAVGIVGIGLGDVDRDGDLDVVVAWDLAASFEDRILWYENTSGDGSTWSSSTVASGLELGSALDPHSLSLGDVDNDGDLDVVAVRTFDTSTYSAYAWKNPMASGAWPAQLVGRSRWSSLQYVDGDGDLDVLGSSPSVITGEGAILRYHDNDLRGVGSFLPAVVQLSSTTTYFGDVFVVAGDLDGDGDADVVSSEESKSSGSTGTLRWHRNQRLHRSAVFPSSEPLAAPGAAGGTIRVVDRDLDGDRDVLVSRPMDDTVTLYVRDQSTGAWSPETVASAASGAASAAGGDLDGDGSFDVVVAEQDDDEVHWYQNLGGTSIWLGGGEVLGRNGSAPRDVDVGDLDGDGDDDVVVALSGEDSVVVLLNKGDGNAWAEVEVSTSEKGAASVRVVDLDRDGDLDIVSAASGIDRVAWHENTAGDGNSWTRHDIASVPGACRVRPLPFENGSAGVVAGGPKDVEVFTSTNAAYTLWARQHREDEDVNGCALDVGDLDGDGDLDLLIGSELRGARWLQKENTLVSGQPWYTPGGTVEPGSPVDDVGIGDADGDGDADLVLALGLPDDSIPWLPNRGGQLRMPTFPVGQGYVPPGGLGAIFRIDFEKTRTNTTIAEDSALAEAVSIELLFEESPGDPLSGAERDALIASHHVYVDDGDDVFEPADDTEASIQTLGLSGGVLRIKFLDASYDGLLTTRSYTPTLFYALEMAADSDQQSPAAFQVTHRLESTPVAKHLVPGATIEDSPASFEFREDVSSVPISAVLSSTSCHAPLTLGLDGLAVETAVECEAGESIVAGVVKVTGPSADLWLRAGAAVVLRAGFSVSDGGSLRVEIDPSLLP